MQFEVVTLFPKMFESPMAEGMIRRGIDNNLINLNLEDMRQWAWNSYGAVDDRPYGGDVGMLIRADVIFRALTEVAKKNGYKFETQSKPKFRDQVNAVSPRQAKVVMMSARGKTFDQETAERWSKLDDLVILCGRYEGFDQRVSDLMIDEEISIGNYILTGGELPAMVLIDSIGRLLPGVLGKDESSQSESFSEIRIDNQMIRTTEYPQYTRPAEFLGEKVPEVLLSGDPKKIKQWQEKELEKNTRK
jgi:tRNA (guanine37-N1)-methyltransferase